MDAWLLDCAEEAGAFLWKSPAEISDGFSVPTAFRFCLKLINGKALRDSWIKAIVFKPKPLRPGAGVWVYFMLLTEKIGLR